MFCMFCQQMYIYSIKTINTKKQRRFLKRRFSLEKHIRWDEKFNNDPGTISIVVRAKVDRGKREPFIYRSADKSLARAGRKQS